MNEHTLEEPSLILDKMRRKRKVKWFQSMAKLFPILMISSAIHLVIFLIIALLPKEEKVKEIPPVIVKFIHNKKEDEIKPEKPTPVILPNTNFKPKIEEPTFDNNETQTPFQINTPPPETTEPPQTPALPEVIGFFDTTLVIPKMNLNPNGFSSLKGSHQNRTGKNKSTAIVQNGGDKATEEAVELALTWLAKHQEKDGSWDAQKYQGKQHTKNNTSASTACALLPFYGAGYSSRSNKYGRTIKSGEAFLNRQVKDQLATNKFGGNYGTALVLMALSESYIYTKKPTTKSNATHITKLLLDQYLEKPGEGWGYNRAGNDLSVTGWVALALKSAKAAELPIMKSLEAKKVEKGYQTWLKQVCDEQTGMGSYRPGHNPSPNMTYVAMFVKQASGIQDSDPFLKAASLNTQKWVQSETTFKNNATRNLYGAYYGTLAAFQAQGQTWEVWNPIMKRALVSSQIKEGPKHLIGSWNPTHDHTGEVGGRVYTTALLALTLEIYYRYNQLN